MFHVSWNTKIRYRVHKSLSLIPVRNITTCYFKIYYNIIFPSNLIIRTFLKETYVTRCIYFKPIRQIYFVKQVRNDEIWGSQGRYYETGVSWVLSPHFPALSLQPWRRRQHVSPKRCNRPTKPHGVKTKDNTSLRINFDLNYIEILARDVMK
jgi:hypothetical protein